MKTMARFIICLIILFSVASCKKPSNTGGSFTRGSVCVLEDRAHTNLILG